MNERNLITIYDIEEGQQFTALEYRTIVSWEYIRNETIYVNILVSIVKIGLNNSTYFASNTTISNYSARISLSTM